VENYRNMGTREGWIPAHHRFVKDWAGFMLRGREDNIQVPGTYHGNVLEHSSFFVVNSAIEAYRSIQP